MHSKKRVAVALGVAVLAPVLAVVLYAVSPGQGAWYPPCVFHLLTGMHCPGCGATRCAHALLHGELRQAAAYNLLFPAVLPMLAVLVTWEGLAWLAGRPTRSLPWPRWSIYALLVLVLAFGMLRNVPVEPFVQLAPHQLPEPLGPGP